MKFSRLQTFDILHKHEEDIPDIVTRINREKRSGNVLILIAGKAQTGKSNTGIWLAYQLTNDPIITFNIEDFFKVASNTTLKNKIIVYDEAQQDIRNWWDIVYKTLKQILESYGYLHHTLIIITPRQRNLYGIFDLFHILIKSRKYWVKNDFTFYGDFYLLDSDLKGKPYFICFETKVIPQVPKDVWDNYMKLKVSNYEIRVKDWMATYEKWKSKRENAPVGAMESQPQEEKDYYVDENGVKHEIG